MDKKLAEAAYAVQNALFSKAAAAPITKETLASVGEWAWKHSFEQTNDDETAFNLLLNYARSLPDPAGYALMSLLVSPNDQLLLLASALWYDLGLPQVIVGHKYAAALMCTSVSPEACEFIRPPWRSFLVELPDGLLHTTDPETGVEVPFVRMIVWVTQRGKWNWSIFTGGTLAVWVHGIDTDKLSDESNEFAEINEWKDTVFCYGMTKEDERLRVVVGRFLQGLCLAMSNPLNVRPMNPAAKSEFAAHRKNKEPAFRTFRIGTEVKVDCREAVKDFLSGRKRRVGSPLTVQSLIRGHWRMQPHGPKGQMRKLIHLEPFWRGPDGAPILSRPIRVDDSAGNETKKKGNK